MASTVELRIGKLGERARSTCELLPCAVVDGEDVVIRCPPGSGESVSEKIVWLWGLLKHQRRKLKAFQTDGATLTCVCTAPPRGSLVLLPNAAEFLHLTGTMLIIDVGAV